MEKKLYLLLYNNGDFKELKHVSIDREWSGIQKED